MYSKHRMQPAVVDLFGHTTPIRFAAYTHAQDFRLLSMALQYSRP